MQADGIPKLYYSISEVAALVGEKAHVLRFWETEFEQLRPRKSRAGKRVYTDEDIAIVRRVQRLLRDDKYTLEGARQQLQQATPPDADLRRELLDLRGFLENLLKRLGDD